MIELIEANWIVLVVALLIGVSVAWWIFVARRRTGISFGTGDVLDEGSDPAARNQALIDAPPVAASSTQPKPKATTPGGDDLSRIKGVGPRIVTLLHQQGVTSFAQIAAWDEAEIDRIDALLDRFAGRIRRDDWPEQARLLGAGDTAGYESKFGKL